MIENKDIFVEIKNVNDETSHILSASEKVAVWFSDKIGSMSFVYFLLIFMILWASINIGLMMGGISPFDQPYHFPILLLLSNIIQLITPLFILISQNIQSKKDRIAFDQEFFMNQKRDHEFNVLFNKLETNQEKIIEMEKRQEQTNEIFSDGFNKTLQTIINEMHYRPCLLKETTGNLPLYESLIQTLEQYKAEQTLEE